MAKFGMLMYQPTNVGKFLNLILSNCTDLKLAVTINKP